MTGRHGAAGVRHRTLVAGGELEYRLLPAASGREDQPTLVFLHEGLGSLGLWRRFPDVVCERTGRAGLVWSRHGYGASEVVDRRRTVRYMHDEALDVLPALLDELSVEVPVLVGHSDGASIALIHTGGSGRPVSGVVALAPHVMVEDRSVEGIAEARREYLTTDLPERLARHHDDVDAAFWGWNDVWLDPAFRDWNIEEYLPGVVCPVLLVQCEDDRYGSLEQLERVERGVAGPVSRLVFPAGGHAPHLTHPDEVADAVTSFLARLDAAGG